MKRWADFSFERSILFGFEVINITKENKEFNELLIKDLKEKGLDLAKIKIKDNDVMEDFWNTTGMVIRPYEDD